MKRFLKTLCLISIFLSGCVKEPAKPVSHLVTAVEITFQKEDVQISRYYTKSPKMEYVLLYLRLLETGKKPDIDPDTLDDGVFQITLTHIDGSTQIYQQKAHRYFSDNGRTWKTIDPKQAVGLYHLMAKIPSDSL